MIKNLLPSGIIKLSEYKRQFEALGLPGAYCLKALYRNALQTTNIELFPREILGSMKTVIDVGANLGD